MKIHSCLRIRRVLAGPRCFFAEFGWQSSAAPATGALWLVRYLLGPLGKAVPLASGRLALGTAVPLVSVPPVKCDHQAGRYFCLSTVKAKQPLNAPWTASLNFSCEISNLRYTRELTWPKCQSPAAIYRKVITQVSIPEHSVASYVAASTTAQPQALSQGRIPLKARPPDPRSSS